MAPDGAERSSEKGPSSSFLVSMQLSFDSIKTSGNVFVEAFTCQKGELSAIHLCHFKLGGAWHHFRQLVPAVRVGPCTKT